MFVCFDLFCFVLLFHSSHQTVVVLPLRMFLFRGNNLIQGLRNISVSSLTLPFSCRNNSVTIYIPTNCSLHTPFLFCFMMMVVVMIMRRRRRMRVCMSVYLVGSWCPQKPEDGVGSPVPGLQMVVGCHVDAGTRT